MIFAAINWLDISINLLLIVFVIVCLLMSLLILMQRPKQEGLGAAFGGGVTDQVFGARTTNVLQKGTVYLGSLFFILSLSLAILIGKQSQAKSLLEPEKEEVVEEKATEEEAEETPASLEDELTEEDLSKELENAVEEAAEDASDATGDAVEGVTEATEEAVEAAEEVVEDAVDAVDTPDDSAPAGENEADKPE